MCEYCGCQALVPIDELTREHELVLSLISQVRPYRGLDQVRDSMPGRTRGDGPARGGSFPDEPSAPSGRLMAGDLTYGAEILRRGQVPGVGRRRQLHESSRKVLAPGPAVPRSRHPAGRTTPEAPSGC